MSRLRFQISMSLDGYVAGPRQSVDHPLGIGGERLHEWVLPLAARRKPHGLEGGEVNENTPFIEEADRQRRRHDHGRNMFGGHPGPWDAKEPWEGWWGHNPPFHHPVFVLTHHARAPLQMEGGTHFIFVTKGIEAALEQARDAARGKDVALGGGADVAQQFLAAGLVDQMDLHVAPILLGGGARLFENTGTDLHGLELVRTVATPQVVHLRFARR